MRPSSPVGRHRVSELASEEMGSEHAKAALSNHMLTRSYATDATRARAMDRASFVLTRMRIF